ncbi:hypothetical protein JCM3770_006211 [Rhodotorula araucariae]
MATSRLKRKVEHADSGQYGNLAESFVSVGTALPALTDTKRDTNEFVPPWEQKVFDEQGRRRFHGAFTGGFSAGYYNSVGSKEGWTPSTFKSSRSNRASQDKRSVADAAKEFMDDEDLAELASSRTLETSSAYASSSQAAPPPSAATYDPLLGNFGALGAAAPAAYSFDATLASLIQPSSSRVGLKLMRKMGWREGQGVGPRVTHVQRRRQAAELGLQPGPDEDDQDGEAGKHYYAPLDRPLTLIKGTSASMDKGWGLGYQPGMNLDQRLQTEGAGMYASSARKPAYDLDDDDVYGGAGISVDALGHREKRAIGIYDAEDDDDEVFGTIRSSRDKRREPPKRSTGPQETFIDGTKVLPGFVLHREPFAGPSQSQLPPPPPPGWQPNPSRLWKENQPPAGGPDVKGKGRQLDADERGSLLGEKQPAPPPDMPKSVFDYLSAKSRERLASLTSVASPAATGANGTPVSGASAAPPPPEPDEELFVPPLDRPTAQAALRGFQPYSTASTSPDAVKQARYTLYLQYQASGSASTTSSPFGPRVLPSGKTQTVSELNRELSEYAQAARVFKPVGGMLGSRFQSSVTGSLDMPAAAPGLYQPPPRAKDAKTGEYLKDVYGDAAASSSSLPSSSAPVPALTPAQQAARAGNFGPGTTRVMRAFRPTKLLCKRFGVRDPHEAADADPSGAGGAWGEATASGWGAGPGNPAAARQPVGEGAMEEMMRSAGFQRFEAAAKDEARMMRGDAPEVAKGTFEAPLAAGAGGGAGADRKSAPRARPTIETVGYGDDEEQGAEILEEKRAPQDIFAAIFADSDDDDDEEEEENGDRAVEANEPAPAPASVAAVAAVGPFPVSASAVAHDPLPASAAVDKTAAVSLSLDTLPSYKPAFVPSAASSVHGDKPKKDRADRDHKKKKRRAPAAGTGLSFDLDEEGGLDEATAGARKKPRRDRGKDKNLHGKEEKKKSPRGPKGERDALEDEDEWAEAPSKVHPDVLAALERPSVAGAQAEGSAPAPAPAKSGRMRAADLY